jgi:two-component system sensor histidine kinase DegS
MSNTLKLVINDMRGIIYNLKPMTLDDLGLTITIQRFANRIMNLHNIQVKVITNEETKEILPVIKLTIFRLVQEACNNIIKHAKASIINIDINYEDHRIKVIVKDNGIGFDVNNPKSGNLDQLSSFGLSNMKERISLLSGSLEITSEEKIGTTVTIIVPLIVCEEEKNE